MTTPGRGRRRLIRLAMVVALVAAVAAWRDRMIAHNERATTP
jgi:hypothetical protein